MRFDGSRFFAFSLAGHVLLGVALASIPAKVRREVVAISFRDAPHPKPAAPVEPTPEREPTLAAPHPTRAKTAPPRAPKPVAEAPAPANAGAPADALPDFGLSLSGSGSGGVAVPMGGGAGDARASMGSAKTLSRASASKDNDCAEPPAKPRPLSRPSPTYTEDARAAGVSGKVRVEITVDAQGRVVHVRVIQGLGHGLDEAALMAARAMTFEPAVRCGRPSSATFKIGFTFAP